MNRVIIFSLMILGGSFCLYGKTYEFPTIHINKECEQYKNNRYTDHILAFNHLFSKVKISSFLEFGVGVGTEFFLNHCDHVTSFELLTPSQNDAWFQECLKKYQQYPHWSPILHVGSEKIQLADDLAKKERKDPLLYDAEYLLEIKDMCATLLKNRSYEVVFVDPGVHFRADIVNELFGKVDIIVAHDTAYGYVAYGWDKICTPNDYIRIDRKKGCGTTFWIHKSREDVIRALIPKYVAQKKKHLRIFFPHMQADVTKSVALLCRYLGHTLLLPGESFYDRASRGLKICYPKYPFPIDLQYLPGDWKDTVCMIENDEIFDHPPDVIFVSCKPIENEMHALLKKLKIKKPDIKLAYYSGNDNTKYNNNLIKNIITTDSSTAKQYNLHAMHYAFWIPWIDWESVEFEGANDSLNFHSYLGNHYLMRGFFHSRDLYHHLTQQCLEKVDFDLQGWISQPELFELMNESMGTIHIKSKEGTGYTIIQSMAKGRPVFLKRSFSKGKRLMNWCIEDRNAIFFDNEEEFEEKLHRYVTDPEFRHFLQENAAKDIRRIIDNERQALIFEEFLQNLR